MTILLTSDWHLTDSPSDEYRWEIFRRLREWAEVQEDEQSEIYILGDICDRKDRHSAKLVNRLVEEMVHLASVGFPITILLGNHDKPVNGPPFWQFLKELNIIFHVAPAHYFPNMYFLPHSDNPLEDWKNIDFSEARVIFMHQLTSFAKADFTTLLPKNIPIYSGDDHVPHTEGNITFVGAPHQVRFGDVHRCRILEINSDSFSIEREIILDPPSKHILDVSSLDDLSSIQIKPGDQVRVRFRLDPNRVEQWVVEESQVAEWAAKVGVTLVSTEPIIETTSDSSVLEANAEMSDPDAVLKTFAASERIEHSLLDVGIDILETYKKGRL